MATRKSGPLDAMVGARIRMLRVDRGMSQAALAERVGVTPQQLQKYERGTSRIGGGRLSRSPSHWAFPLVNCSKRPRAELTARVR